MQKNIHRRSHFNVGFNSGGFHELTVKGVHTKEYVYWKNMLSRCYGSQRKSANQLTVCDSWLDFQNFAEWCTNQRGFFGLSWSLDKDLLVKANTTYSPDACCFVPHLINSAIQRKVLTRGDLPIRVHYNKLRKNYSAKTTEYGAQISLGTFSNPADAFFAYKIRKEKYIKCLADEFVHNLDVRAYEALNNFEINIDD